jgi:hypothetical protein
MVYIVYIQSIVYIPYARDMHRKEVFFSLGFEPAACGLADNGFISIRLYFAISRNSSFSIYDLISIRKFLPSICSRSSSEIDNW